MLYNHHGLNYEFSGNYEQYFSLETEVDACVYLMLANELIHSINPEAVVVGEDVSGMPTLCRPVSEGGLGFDYRLVSYFLRPSHIANAKDLSLHILRSRFHSHPCFLLFPLGNVATRHVD